MEILSCNARTCEIKHGAFVQSVRIDGICQAYVCDTCEGKLESIVDEVDGGRVISKKIVCHHCGGIVPQRIIHLSDLDRQKVNGWKILQGLPENLRVLFTNRKPATSLTKEARDALW